MIRCLQTAHYRPREDLKRRRGRGEKGGEYKGEKRRGEGWETTEERKRERGQEERQGRGDREERQGRDGRDG